MSARDEYGTPAGSVHTSVTLNGVELLAMLRLYSIVCPGETSARSKMRSWKADSSPNHRTDDKSTRPYPISRFGREVGHCQLPSGSWNHMGCPLWIITALTNAADGSNPSDRSRAPVLWKPSLKYCLTSAAEPAHSGVAMDVPLIPTT